MKRPLRLKDRLTKAQLLKRRERILYRATPVSKRLREERAPAIIIVNTLGSFNLFERRK